MFDVFVSEAFGTGLLVLLGCGVDSQLEDDVGTVHHDIEHGQYVDLDCEDDQDQVG